MRPFAWIMLRIPGRNERFWSSIRSEMTGFEGLFSHRGKIKVFNYIPRHQSDKQTKGNVCDWSIIFKVGA